MSTDAKSFTPCPSCGEDPNPITKDGRCGHCGKWLFYVIEVDESTMHCGRNCMVCGENFELGGYGDNRTICPECCEVIKGIKVNCKRNWVAGSKGGEPNHYKDENERTL